MVLCAENSPSIWMFSFKKLDLAWRDLKLHWNIEQYSICCDHVQVIRETFPLPYNVIITNILYTHKHGRRRNYIDRVLEEPQCKSSGCRCQCHTNTQQIFQILIWRKWCQGQTTRYFCLLKCSPCQIRRLQSHKFLPCRSRETLQSTRCTATSHCARYLKLHLTIYVFQVGLLSGWFCEVWPQHSTHTSTHTRTHSHTHMFCQCTPAVSCSIEPRGVAIWLNPSCSPWWETLLATNWHR